MEANKKEEKRLEQLALEEKKEQESMTNKQSNQNVVIEGTPKNSPITSDKIIRPSSILEMYSGKKSMETVKSPKDLNSPRNLISPRSKISPRKLTPTSSKENFDKMEKEVIKSI